MFLIIRQTKNKGNIQHSRFQIEGKNEYLKVHIARVNTARFDWLAREVTSTVPLISMQLMRNKMASCIRLVRSSACVLYMQ